MGRLGLVNASLNLSSSSHVHSTSTAVPSLIVSTIPSEQHSEVSPIHCAQAGSLN